MNLNPVISRLAVLQIFMLILTWIIAGLILKGQAIMHGDLNPFSTFFRFHGYTLLFIPLIWTFTAWGIENFAPTFPRWVSYWVFGLGLLLVFSFPIIGYVAVAIAPR